ncbi:MAG: 5'/3'-nucleotidase SurE [Baekduia sp.]
MRVLLTNDDGIEAAGLRRMRQELLAAGGVDLVVIAPDGNRSAVGRGISFRRPVHVASFAFDSGPAGWSADGTPVDCVRLADLGLAGGAKPDLVVSGINHGANLGDDIAYSGTVAAALEGVVLGIPAIAVSQDWTRARPPQDESDPFGQAARFVARLVGQLESVPLDPGTMLNVNVPTVPATGVDVCSIGRRVYYDTLQAEGEIGADGAGRYVLYNAEPGFHEAEGTDVSAVAAGKVAITPLHLDLTHHDAVGPLTEAALGRLLDDR